ncbi:MAG: O-antigen ligase family protein [Candidatus Moranbacteria bacterium]|nr:O-antigen ligase family protein [Candidatus Moranbacteria bacterium]
MTNKAELTEKTTGMKHMTIALTMLLLFYLPIQSALNIAPEIDVASGRVLILILTLLWAYEGIIKKNLHINTTVQAMGLTTLLLLNIISLGWAENTSWGIRKVLFLATTIPLFFVIADIARATKTRQKLLSSFVLGTTTAGIIGIMQWLTQFIVGYDALVKFWGKIIAPIFLGHAFSEAVIEYSSWLVSISGQTIMRAVGTFPDPHMFGFYLGLALPWAITKTFTSNKKTLFLLASAIIIIADMLTFSRGAYLGLVAGAIATLALYTKKIYAKKTIIFAVTCLALLTIGLSIENPIKNRLVSIFDVYEGSNNARIIIWNEAIETIKNHPIGGVGIGNYASEIKPSADYREPIYAHNLFLDITAETGMPSGLITLTVLLIASRDFIKRKNPFFMVGAISIAIFTAHAMVETPLYSVSVFPALLFILGLSTITTKDTRDKKTETAKTKENKTKKSFKLGEIIIKTLPLITLACTPLYLVRFSIGEINTNALDILILTTIFASLRKNGSKKIIKNLWKKERSIITATGIMVMAIIISFATNTPSTEGLGIIKSWIILPIGFGLATYIIAKNTLPTNTFFKSLCVPATTLALKAIMEYAIGTTTFDNRTLTLFESPNQLAFILAPAILICGYLWKTERKNGWIYATALPIIMTGLYTTKSIAPWFALSIAIIATTILTQKKTKKRLLLLTLSLLAPIIVVLSLSNTQRFNEIKENITHSSIGSRATILLVTKKIIKEHPVLGIGPGNFQKEYLKQQKYFPPYPEWAVPHPHNTFLAFWIFGGITGLLSFTTILLLWSKKLYKNYTKTKNATSTILLGAMIYFATHGFADTLFWKNDLALFFWTIIALGFLTIHTKNTPTNQYDTKTDLND